MPFVLKINSLISAEIMEVLIYPLEWEVEDSSAERKVILELCNLVDPKYFIHIQVTGLWNDKTARKAMTVGPLPLWQY